MEYNQQHRDELLKTVQLADAVQLQDPLAIKDASGGSEGIVGIVQNVNKAVLGLVGIVALVAFIYGGVLLLISQGEQDKVQKAKSTILYAIIGLVVIFSSYAILNFIVGALGGGK